MKIFRNKACWQISDIGRLAGNCTKERSRHWEQSKMLRAENDAAKHSASHSDFGDVGFVGVLSDDDNDLKRDIH